MPIALDLPDGVYKREDGRWIRICPSCSSEISHLRRNYCVGAHTSKQVCKKCSNISNHPSGMVGSVRLAWFDSFKRSGITRGYDWEISPEFVDTLYDQQNGRCALSSLPIGWSVVGWNHTASLDRIDNSGGYTEENVQLVHKKINMMRGSLSVEEFIHLCQCVADNNKEN